MTRRRGITDKRQVQFRLLTPRQNPANIRWFVSLVIKHLLIIRVTKNSFLLCNASPHIKGDSILASRHYCTSVLSTGRHTHTHTHRGVRTPQEPSSNLTGKTTVGKQPVLLKTPVSRRAKRLGSRPDRRARGVPGQGTPPWGTGRGTRRPGAAAHQAGPGRAGPVSSPHPGRPRGGTAAPIAPPPQPQAAPGRPQPSPGGRRRLTPPHRHPSRGDPRRPGAAQPGARLLPETWRWRPPGRGGRGGATWFSLPRQPGAAAEGRAGPGRTRRGLPPSRRPRTAGPRRPSARNRGGLGAAGEAAGAARPAGEAAAFPDGLFRERREEERRYRPAPPALAGLPSAPARGPAAGAGRSGEALSPLRRTYRLPPASVKDPEASSRLA